MFINEKNGHKAFLIAHDNGEVTFSAAPAEDGKPHHTVPADTFFAEHREANRVEIEDYYDERPAPKLAVGKGKDKEPAPEAVQE